MTALYAKKFIIFVAVFVLLVFGGSNKIYLTTFENGKCYKINKESILLSPVSLEVDLNGNIYIATVGQINVYDSTGIFLHAIRVPLGGCVMRMKMLEDDIISIALNRSGGIYVVTAEGNLIEKKEDSNSNIYSEYGKYQKKVRIVSGNTYKLTNIFGYTQVVKYSSNGTKSIIYRIPFWKWLIKVLFYLIVCIVWPTIIIYLLIKFKTVWAVKVSVKLL